MKTEITTDIIYANYSTAIKYQLESLKNECKEFAKNNKDLIRNRRDFTNDLIEVANYSNSKLRVNYFRSNSMKTFKKTFENFFSLYFSGKILHN
jgi:hypothetical protein